MSQMKWMLPHPTSRCRTLPSATVRPSQTTTPTRLSSRLRTRRAIRRKCSRSGATWGRRAELRPVRQVDFDAGLAARMFASEEMR